MLNENKMRLISKRCSVLIILLLELCHGADACSIGSPEARKFFEIQNELLRQRERAEYLSAYEYNTNVSEENRIHMIAVAAQNAIENKKFSEAIRDSRYDQSDDPCLQRQARKLADAGFAVLNPEDFHSIKNAISSMQTHYANTKVCPYKTDGECTLALEPHIQERMSNSRDPKELAHYWREWHDKAGAPMKENFAKYVQLSRKAAKINNFTSYADYWIHFYQDPDFEKYLHESFQTIQPLYRELHAYVRHRLLLHYGADIVSAEGNIPIHLLGNMWGQSWNEIVELIKPYANRSFVDVTSELKKQSFTVSKMFELGDEFFQSLGMRPLPASFWNLSVLEKPEDRAIVCHASAWDLYENSDVRIKMCTEVNNHYLYVVHHELGHIQYYLQYEDQPTAFRSDPNPGFHEAVGDVIGLSVSSTKHLHAIGLSSVAELDAECRINELFKMALSKVAFLPFAYTMDKFRYLVFRDEISPADWNCAFWLLRSEYSGIEPSMMRSNHDFDPTAKYHIIADVEYLRYYASHIFQFQFHKALCSKAGQYVKGDAHKTLDNCDIYKSKEAGQAFSHFLSAGSSRHWSEILYEFTGDKKMDPSALLEYFAPLHQWLQEENRKLKIPIGWNTTEKVPSSCSDIY